MFNIVSEEVDKCRIELGLAVPIPTLPSVAIRILSELLVISLIGAAPPVNKAIPDVFPEYERIVNVGSPTEA
jgi:hypothetical protein